MFPVGLSMLDPRRTPRLYLVYWLVILLLVVWLMGLAFKDIRFTLTHDGQLGGKPLRPAAPDEHTTDNETRA